MADDPLRHHIDKLDEAVNGFQRMTDEISDPVLRRRLEMVCQNLHLDVCCARGALSISVFRRSVA